MNGTTDEETYSGPVSNQLPNITAAQLVFNTKACRYLLFVEFGVHTTFSGDPLQRPNVDAATGGAWSGYKHIPSSLKPADAPVPLAYDASYCNQAKFYSQGCYGFGGNWDSDFETLKTCQGTCGSALDPVGNALFSWSLRPG
jgi:hypothetical protein